MSEDTIAAISTAAGRGGVAIIRVSGDEALSIAEKMFRPTGKTAVRNFVSYHMYPGNILAEHFTDFGLCVYFKSPCSYTGEDVVEFHCHGGTEIANGILKRTFTFGARPAEAGEFTKRAFLNGKMSLSAAEGVIDMINAQSESMIKAGYSLYRNELGREVQSVQDRLTTLLASIEVDIDYPEEDLEHSLPDLVNVKEDLYTLYKRIDELKNSYDIFGKKVKNGISVAIVGKPNSGKSSLLNAILGYNKAIVSDVAGTTRDVVEGVIEIKGLQFNLYDTAGMRESKDVIERIGVEKAERIMDEADVVLHVVDGSNPPNEEDAALSKTAAKKKRLLHLTILNKSDLFSEKKIKKFTSDAPALEISAKENKNIETLLETLYSAAANSYNFNNRFVVEERHYKALKIASERLQKAYEKCGGAPMDMLTVDIAEAWRSLGEITGETANEEIINEIFSKFCVGK